jgi:hypothetical protein
MYVCMYVMECGFITRNEVFGLEILYPVSLPFAFSILLLLKGLQFVSFFVLFCYVFSFSFSLFFFPPGIYVCMLWMGIGYQI